MNGTLIASAPLPSTVTGGMFRLPVIGRRADGIDCLRAVLAVWVLFTHLIPWARASSGIPEMAVKLRAGLVYLFQTPAQTHPAVLAFIVLSGYCIHRNGLRRDRADLRAYVIRRVFRILPIYLLGAFVGAGAFWWAGRMNPTLTHELMSTQEMTLRHFLLKLSGLSAWMPSWHVASLEGNAPLATVMVEMWLYVLYPLVFLLCVTRRNEIFFWVALAAVWSGSLWYVTRHVAEFGMGSWWGGGSVINFALYWWIGAKLVDGRFAALIRRSAPGLLLVWIGLTVLLVRRDTDSLWLIEARKLIFVLLVGILITQLEGFDFRAMKAGAFIGRAGYSIYALHAPLLAGFLVLGLTWWQAALLTLGIGLAVCGGFEQPLNRLGRRIGARGNSTPVFAATALTRTGVDE